MFEDLTVRDERIHILRLRASEDGLRAIRSANQIYEGEHTASILYNNWEGLYY